MRTGSLARRTLQEGPVITAKKYLSRIVEHELADLLKHLPAVSLEGPKGVGKTETASRMAATLRELDSPAQRALAEADAQQLLVGRKPILIDEWQRVPQVWDAVRRAIDRDPSPNQFILTGSASPHQEPTHSGAGRIVTLRMRPLSYFEQEPDKATVSFRQLLAGERPRIEGQSDVGLRDYVRRMVASGFPGLLHLQGRALRAQLDGYITRILDRDFGQFGINVRSPDAVRRWMAAYAAASSTCATFEAIRDASTPGEVTKPAKSTLIPYRNVLEKLWILDAVPAWLPSENALSHMSQPPKHQLADPALAIRLLGLSEETLLNGEEGQPLIAARGPLLGRLFESYVSLCLRPFAQHEEASVKHFRTKGGEREIDLIIERSDKKILAIEVKLSQEIRDEDVKHLLWLEKRLGSSLVDRVVISAGPAAYRRPDGVAVIPLALLGL
jgi:predicted AAA+ superfamily ATPase